MARLLFLLFLSSLLVGCNDMKREEVEDQVPQKSADIKVSTMENEEKESIAEGENSEKVELPIEKDITVNLNGKEVWEVYNGMDIIKVYGEGEKLFMFDDAQKLEDKVISEYEKTEPDGTLMKWSTYIDVFIAQTKEYRPDQSEYYDKLNEVVKLIRDEGDKSVIVEKVNEAKEIRTSNK